MIEPKRSLESAKQFLKKKPYLQEVELMHVHGPMNADNTVNGFISITQKLNKAYQTNKSTLTYDSDATHSKQAILISSLMYVLHPRFHSAYRLRRFEE